MCSHKGISYFYGLRLATFEAENSPNTDVKGMYLIVRLQEILGSAVLLEDFSLKRLKAINLSKMFLNIN